MKAFSIFAMSLLAASAAMAGGSGGGGNNPQPQNRYEFVTCDVMYI